MGPLERGRDGELEAVQRRNRILLEDIMRMSIEFGALCENQNKYCLCFLCWQPELTSCFLSCHLPLACQLPFCPCRFSAAVPALFKIPCPSSQKRKTTTISVEVKKSQHKYIIGPKGNTLQEILEATGVSVEMPPLDSGSETIILRGEPDRLGPALTQVYAKVRRRRHNSDPVCGLIVEGCLCTLCAGEERDGGGGDRPRLAAPLHHRQEGAEHRAHHAAAATGENRAALSERRPRATQGDGGGGNPCVFLSRFTSNLRMARSGSVWRVPRRRWSRLRPRFKRSSKTW